MVVKDFVIKPMARIWGSLINLIKIMAYSLFLSIIYHLVALIYGALAAIALYVGILGPIILPPLLLPEEQWGPSILFFLLAYLLMLYFLHGHIERIKERLREKFEETKGQRHPRPQRSQQQPK